MPISDNEKVVVGREPDLNEKGVGIGWEEIWESLGIGERVGNSSVCFGEISSPVHE